VWLSPCELGVGGVLWPSGARYPHASRPVAYWGFSLVTAHGLRRVSRVRGRTLSGLGDAGKWDAVAGGRLRDIII